MNDIIAVKEIRSRLGMTQAQLGEAVGVDQSTVSNWENGAPPRGPARKLLQNLAEQSRTSPREATEHGDCPAELRADFGSERPASTTNT